VGKTLTDLQILGCELQQNAFGGFISIGETKNQNSTAEKIK